MPDVPPYSGASYDISARDLGIGGLITAGALAAIGVGMFVSGAVVASGAPLAAYPSVVPGTLFIATSPAHAAQIAAALAALDASAAAGTPLAFGVTDVLTTCAITAPISGGAWIKALIISLTAGSLAPYAQGANAPLNQDMSDFNSSNFYPGPGSFGAPHNTGGVSFHVLLGEYGEYEEY